MYKAASVFHRLVGGRVVVIAEPRPGRKRPAVRGRFTPSVFRTTLDAVGADAVPDELLEVEGTLRREPRLDAIAPEVRRLYEEEQLGFRAIAKKLGIGCGNAYASYLRYFEMRGLPAPPRHPRGRWKRCA